MSFLVSCLFLDNIGDELAKGFVHRSQISLKRGWGAETSVLRNGACQATDDARHDEHLPKLPQFSRRPRLKISRVFVDALLHQSGTPAPQLDRLLIN